LTRALLERSVAACLFGLSLLLLATAGWPFFFTVEKKSQF